jgi:protein involved in polysaccharide export with SLBB domain
MQVEILINGVSAIDLTNFVDYRHLSNVGLGMPPVQLYQEQGPLQHGANYIDYRLQPRDITLVIGAVAGTFDEYMALRRELLFALKPKSQYTMSLRLNGFEVLCT